MHSRLHRDAGRAAVALSAALALVACDFQAQNPRAITEPDLSGPEAIPALVNGVIGDYDQAFHRTVMLSGLLSDELRPAGTWASWTEAETRGTINLDAPAGDGQNIAHDWWSPLQRARHLAEETYQRIQTTLPDAERSPLAALTRLYSGMAYRDIGEYFCVAAYGGGPAVQREQSLAIAAEHLGEAMQIAGVAGADSIARMARLARARVHLAAGRPEQALADAREVPNGFRWMARYRDNPEEYNRAFMVLNELAQGTVTEGFATLGDPRVVAKRNGVGPDKTTPRWDQQKFTRHTDLPVGKWQEARLIEAEVLLGRGEVGAAIALLNQVRAAAALPALPTTLSGAEATTALRRERRAELFLEGHRMLDMRRNGEFPAGWQAGCVPLPRSETDSNPNL